MALTNTDVSPTVQKALKLPEFILLLAMMISVLALSIDAMLPALDVIGKDLGVVNPNDVQLVISAMFLGFAAGQIISGPLSDSFGRKPVIYWGYIIFIIGTLMCMFAGNFTVMLVGRVLQGLGAAAPRIVSLALVRDCYEGRAMARIMSIVMAVFVLIPAVAPAIGQGVLLVADWRGIFIMLLLTAVVAFAWFGIRQPETLASADRRKFSLKNIMGGIGEVLTIRIATGYTITAGFAFGGLLGYLNSAQQVFQIAYNSGQYFALYFGMAALAIGAASIFNSRVVVRLGMRYMTWRSLLGLTAFSCAFCLYMFVYGFLPPLWLTMIWLIATFFCFGILFGNFNALAMEPLGHLAGLGAAVVGSLSTFIALPLGWLIGYLFDGTVLPLVGGFASLGLVSLAAMWWTERGLETVRPS